ncbi:MAG TPA: dienelactone hydrolase family protein [Fibrobacteria bacterium]|nr:dienelactone hydrolase family protein [Fibrobacteria bacterium]
MMMQEWFSEGFPVQVPAGTSILDAEMQVPGGANGLIVLAHAGGRQRYSQRVQNVAEYFTKDGFGILVMDLLTEEESEIAKQAEEYGVPGEDGTCFDAEMLAERLDDSLQWVRDLPEAAGLPLGLFGTGPGAWAAFSVAASRAGQVSAVVAAGLPKPAEFGILGSVRSPTLLIAGNAGESDAAFARECLGALPGRKRLEFVPDYAGGKEDSPRVTEKVSRLACQWFEQHLQ